jgi:primosomal protein N' (replication factor Y)
MCKNKTQEEIVRYISDNKSVLKNEVQEISNSSVTTLIRNGVIKETYEEMYRLKRKDIKKESKKILNEEQTKAYEEIIKGLKSNKKFLLYGVTGSGKTEIYMQVIEQVIKSNKTAIVLVPEISLTPQFVSNFESRFSGLIAVLHSALSDGEKYDEWRKITKGDVKIVIGARSAIFAPLKNLGIIIVDEEHSESYKQENNPRYNAIDVAEFRAEINNIPIVLGSATPTLEKMARASKNLYQLLTIKNRVNKMRLPNCKIVDMAKEIKKGNFLLSDELKNEIESSVSRGEQVLLLLNRRGFSTTITCSSCGYTYKCPNCDITLTYHKTKNNLRCHYCGYTVYKKDGCPKCGTDLNFYGYGTEKLEEEIKKEFTDLRVLRMDADTTKNKNAHEKIIEKFKNHEYDILLGTQMISKGLDFPLVSLVGIINADTTLNIPDFRSGERTFDLLYQASGRAGRKDTIGNVVIQTFNPDNFILKCVEEQSYEKFYNYEMNIRKKLKYPPFYYLVSLKVTGKDYESVSKEATKAASFIRKNIEESSIVLGPTTSNVFKVNNVYRFQIIIKYRFDKKLMNTLKELDKLFVLNKKVNLEIDINPTKI